MLGGIGDLSVPPPALELGDKLPRRWAGNASRPGPLKIANNMPKFLSKSAFFMFGRF